MIALARTPPSSRPCYTFGGIDAVPRSVYAREIRWLSAPRLPVKSGAFWLLLGGLVVVVRRLLSAGQ
ncbi:hypothetical protein KCP70_13480 [Salmonella enterica subsp. enterica]|nr:hypothetical protein KCP70_13480 [Salmonella enterica subsp. enterica]